MESVLANFDIDDIKNFWKIYPTWKTPKDFNSLYEKDKSKEKSESSLIMWAVCHMFDKSEINPYRSMDSKDRIEVINDDILNNHEFDWEKYKDVVKLTEKILMTEEERAYYSFLEYAENRRRFIDDQNKELNFEAIKSLDEVIRRNKSIAEELDRLKSIVEQTTDSGKVKGDRIESAREKGYF